MNDQIKPLLDLLGGNSGWVGTVVAWLAALKLASTFWSQAFNHWVSDKFNQLAAGTDDDNAYLRALFAKAGYKTASIILHLLGFRLPTTSDLERAIKLQHEAVVASGTPPTPVPPANPPVPGTKA